MVFKWGYQDYRKAFKGLIRPPCLTLPATGISLASMSSIPLASRQGIVRARCVANGVRGRGACELLSFPRADTNGPGFFMCSNHANVDLFLGADSLQSSCSHCSFVPLLFHVFSGLPNLLHSLFSHVVIFALSQLANA